MLANNLIKNVNLVKSFLYKVGLRYSQVVYVTPANSFPI